LVARQLRPVGLADDTLGDLGGAVGYLQFAKVAEDVAHGVAEVGAACGACHAQQSVPRPAPPPWTHARGAERLAWGLVWSGVEAPPQSGEALGVVAEAWAQAEVTQPDTVLAPPSGEVVRTAAALLACAGCHQRTSAIR
jgi:cytochrome c553